MPLGRRVGLSVPEKLIKRETDVFGNLTQQDRRDIPALVKWNRRVSCLPHRGIVYVIRVGGLR